MNIVRVGPTSRRLRCLVNCNGPRSKPFNGHIRFVGAFRGAIQFIQPSTCANVLCRRTRCVSKLVFLTKGTCVAFFHGLRHVVRRERRRRFRPLPNYVGNRGTKDERVFRFGSQLRFQARTLGAFLTAHVRFCLLPQRLPRSQVRVHGVRCILRRARRVYVITLRLFGVLTFLRVVRLLLDRRNEGTSSKVRQDASFVNSVLCGKAFSLTRFFRHPTYDFRLTIRKRNTSVRVDGRRRGRRCRSTGNRNCRRSFLIRSNARLRLLRLRPIRLGLYHVFT